MPGPRYYAWTEKNSHNRFLYPTCLILCIWKCNFLFLTFGYFHMPHKHDSTVPVPHILISCVAVPHSNISTYKITILVGIKDSIILYSHHLFFFLVFMPKSLQESHLWTSLNYCILYWGASLISRLRFLYISKYKKLDPGASPIRIINSGASLNCTYLIFYIPKYKNEYHWAAPIVIMNSGTSLNCRCYNLCCLTKL